ncbi:MAG: MASE3 domain-containing protein [Syntrophobacteraceae bacterium]|nr:PAS domain S-box protein [Desulfobacteraceae bacterium]
MASIIFYGSAGAIVLAALGFSSTYSYTLFHSLAEIFSVCVIWSIFVLTWNTRRFLENHYLLFIGIAYLFVGVIDVLHMLSYKGMGVFHGYDTNLPTQLWIASRYMQSISLLAAPLFLQRRLNHTATLLGYALATSLVLLSTFVWRNFPDCFLEGAGLTPFKVISEYVICLLFAGAAAALFCSRGKFDRHVLSLLLWSIILSVGSDLAFTFYVHVYGLSNLVGHLLKIASSALVYKAIVETGLTKPYDILFRDLKQSESALRSAHDQLEAKVRERTRELVQANLALEQQMGERVVAEEALRRSELKYRELVQNANSIIVRLDSEGNIVFFNEYAQMFFGFKEEEILGRHPLGTIVPETDSSGKDLKTLLREVINDAEKHGNSENENIRKNGERVWVSWTNKALFDENGSFCGVLCIGNDITRRKRIEEELERSNRELQDFAFIASHDLQEPLRKIYMFGDFLARKHGESLSEQGQDYLRRMRTASVRMRELIDSLLEYSRVRTKSNPFSVVDLNEVVRGVLSDLETLIEKTGAVVTTEGLPIIEADANQMRQLFQNLIGNALKYHGQAPPSVKITGSPAPKDDDEGIQTARWQILVADNGIGFDEKYAEQIFAPFRRLHGRSDYEGTGMGLAICRKIVERHGGSITASSIPGKGSRFTIDLPAQQVSAKQPSVPTRP